MGYRRWLCDHVWAISADYRPDCDGRLSWYEEEFAIRIGYFARRHLYLRMSSVRHDRNHRCVAVPAGRRTRTTGGSFWSYSVRRLTSQDHDILVNDVGIS